MVKVTLPFIGMIMTECVQVGLIILSKQAMAQGMTNFVFIFYSNSIAALIFLPSSFFIHRFECPPITFSTLFEFFILALIGYLDQVFGYAGFHYSPPTLSTSIRNLVPGFTFILAVAFRMEKLDWRSSGSLAKSLGTIVSISGAFIATLYKGVALLNEPTHANLSLHPVSLHDSNWILGGLFLTADCVMNSAFTIVQASILKKYPAELIVVFFYCFFVAILSAVTSLVVGSDISAWSLEPKLTLLAVLYAGVIGSGFLVGVTAWCLHQTGPVFVSMFKPIEIVISIIIGVVILGDALYLGSFIGAVVIVIGFYSVLWGISKDTEAKSLESRNIQTPLLKENII